MHLGLKVALFTKLIIFSSAVFAETEKSSGSGLTIDGVFSNATPSIIALISLTKYFALFMGLFLIVSAIFKLAKLRTEQGASARVPISYFIIGTIFFSFTGAIDVVFQTVSMQGGPGYVLIESEISKEMNANYQATIRGVLIFIQFVGYISFFWGWHMLNQYASGKRSDGMGSGITHIVGGLLAINILFTGRVLVNTFAPGLKVPFL